MKWWPWIARFREARIRNELAQMCAIREEMITAGADDMVQWCNGAIFTLSWLVAESGAVAPSHGIHPFRPKR